jgi:hypothetical protein
MKRTMFAAAAALLAVAALPGRAAADTTAPPSPAAPVVWQPQGTAISGTATTADAPALKPGTTYRDSIRPGQTRMYGVALDARSSAYASAFAVPPAGSRVAYNDGIEIELTSADGTQCDSGEEHFDDDGDARPIGTAVARTITDPDDICQDANAYTLQVHRTSAGTSDPAPWPLELRLVLEPPLASGAVPGPVPTTPSASPTPLTAGTPRPASGGASFETAAAVRTGIWTDRVLPGETRFYKVPVDWGQRATVFADFSSAPDRKGFDLVGEGTRLTVFSPTRQYVDGVDAGYDGDPAALVEQLAPVAYANRTSDDDTVQRVRYAGWYYVAVTVHPDVARMVKGALPITLRVEVEGAAQAGPHYSGDPASSGIGLSRRAAEAADGTATGGSSASAAPSSSALRLLGFGAIGAGTVLLLSLAVWYVLARRQALRSGRTAS